MAREGARSKDSAKPGIKEVAAVAGVSPTTVSRVLNNRGYISQETRDKVHAAMKRINYTPNDIARAMLNGRLNLIGMIVPYVSSPFHAQAVQAVERTLAENGFKMLLCNSANRPDLERSYIDMLRRNMVDGVIVNSLNIGAEAYAEMGLSLVGIDCDLGETSVQIASDSYGIGELATRRLIDDGCSRILCLRNNSRMRMPINVPMPTSMLWSRLVCPRLSVRSNSLSPMTKRARSLRRSSMRTPILTASLRETTRWRPSAST